MSTDAENAERAERAYRLVLVYKQRHDAGEDFETVLSDLLTDLMHLADEEGGDFDRCLESARMHYEAEREEVEA